MAKKRRGARRTERNGDGAHHPALEAFHHAYHDAMYARILQRIEDDLREPEVNEIVDRFTSDMAAAYNRLLVRREEAEK